MVVIQSLVIVVSSVFVIGILATSVKTQEDSTDSNDDWKRADYLFIYSTFTLFLIVYVAVLIMLVKRLKRHFPSFYLKERKQILIASVSVIISLVARIGINILYSFDSVNDALDDSYTEDTWLFPISQLIVILLASLFPIASVIYSLMYALTHKKRMMKKSKKFGQVINASGRCQSIHSLLQDEVNDIPAE